MKTSKTSRWQSLGSLNKGLIIGVVGAIIFMIAYFCVNVAFIHFYDASSCTNSSRIGIFLTAPINYCEDVGVPNQTLREGLIANMAIPAAIMLAAITYSISYEKKFKKFLSFKSVLLIAIASTYLLSILNALFLGKPGAGTSIIGFNLLLFLFLGLLVDFGSFRKDPHVMWGTKEILPIAALALKLNALSGEKSAAK